MFTRRNFVLLALQLALVFGLVASYYDRYNYKKEVYFDRTNDDAVGLTTIELVQRSGYGYQEYYVVADDGYITQLVRIINPAAAETRKPPVMLFHGANVDNSIYIAASSKQHQPEPFPRSMEDGPMMSYNRSLAFMLANNGYDVWLIGQRGSNHESQAYIDPETFAYEKSRIHSLDFRPDESMYEFIKTKSYWQYGLDDVTRFEIKNQIDRVRQVTGQDEQIIFSFSLSTPTTMAFLAAHPNYAERTLAYIQMGPAIAADHFTLVDRVYFEKIISKLPTRGIGFTPTFKLKSSVRSVIMKLNKNPKTRWSIVNTFCKTLFGPNLKYNTNLESNMVSRVFQEVSFKTVQQYGQNSITKKLTAFNYGDPERNFKRYLRATPPPYDVSKLQVPNWIVIWGTYDALADSTTVQRLIETTQTPSKPIQIVAPGQNHFDLVAGTENDRYVNLPLLEELNKITE